MLRIRWKRPILIALAISVVAMPAVAADLSTKFARVSTGLTRDAVIAVMEVPPTSIQQTATFGMEKVRLRWQDGTRGPAYVVILLAGRVVQTESCDPGSDC